MNATDLQHAVEYFFFRRFRASILSRPHAEIRAYGARLGRWGHALVPKARKLALWNLERVFPEKAADERARIVRSCFEHFGSHFCETLSLERQAPSELMELFDIEGWHHIEALRQRGKGFFLHAGHYGHWEMAIYPFALKLAPFYAVARPPNNPRVARDMMALRQRLGVTILEKKGAAYRMRTACRQGGHVAIVIDQHIRPSAGIRVPFFGYPAWTSPVLAILSLRLRTPIVPFACLPAEEPGRYRLEIREPLWGETEGELGDDPARAEAELTRRVLADVEADIRRRPELWLWMHRRWRDGPAPQAESRDPAGSGPS